MFIVRIDFVSELQEKWVPDNIPGYVPGGQGAFFPASMFQRDEKSLVGPAPDVISMTPEMLIMKFNEGIATLISVRRDVFTRISIFSLNTNQ